MLYNHLVVIVLVLSFCCHCVVFLHCFFIVFLQEPRNLHMFRHKVGPKHRFLQCCFNLFFVCAFLSIKKTRFFAVFSVL